MAESILAWLAFGSLVALLSLRLYAAFATTPIHTPWDDDSFRISAIQHARRQSLLTAARHLLLPWKPPVSEGRLDGYDAWLVAGLKVARAFACRDAELAFQLVNSVILLLQALVVLLFARWATDDWPSAAAWSFLYTSVPIVFGTSRWVLSENLVLLACPTWSFAVAWLLDKHGGAGAISRSRLCHAALAAYAMGVLLSAREYATPSYVALTSAVLLGLLVRKHWAEAAIAGVVSAAFIVPWAPSFAEALEDTLGKGGRNEYFHAMTEWIPHVAFYTVGPAFTLLLALLLVLVVWHGWKETVARLRAPDMRLTRLLRDELSTLHVAGWAHWSAMAFYLAGIIWTRNRITRPAILPMVTALGIVLIWLRRNPSVRDRIRSKRARWAAAGLIVASWCVLLWQLLVAFDGGKTYAHAGFRLEYFNYPLHLRKLSGPDDSHVCIDPCPYDRLR